MMWNPAAERIFGSSQGEVTGKFNPLVQAQQKQEFLGLHERVLARTPAGRWGTADDLAGVAVFLASPASDFVTGTAIPVDGGYSSQG